MGEMKLFNSVFCSRTSPSTCKAMQEAKTSTTQQEQSTTTPATRQNTQTHPGLVDNKWISACVGGAGNEDPLSSERKAQRPRREDTEGWCVAHTHHADETLVSVPSLDLLLQLSDSSLQSLHGGGRGLLLCEPGPKRRQESLVRADTFFWTLLECIYILLLLHSLSSLTVCNQVFNTNDWNVVQNYYRAWLCRRTHFFHLLTVYNRVISLTTEPGLHSLICGTSNYKLDYMPNWSLCFHSESRSSSIIKSPVSPFKHSGQQQRPPEPSSQSVMVFLLPWKPVPASLQPPILSLTPSVQYTIRPDSLLFNTALFPQAPYLHRFTTSACAPPPASPFLWTPPSSSSSSFSHHHSSFFS